MSQSEKEHGIDVEWTDVTRFLRQLSHDLRNQLNAVELQSAFLAELATDPEIQEEIKRLRKMISECGSTLQKLSIRLNPPAPNPMSYPATDFVEDVRTRVRSEFPKQADAVSWEMETNEAQLHIDPQLLQEGLLELLRNAFEHQVPGSSLHFHAKTEDGNVVFTLHEPKAQFDLPTQNWGREPLRYVNRSHYGLGLNRARTIVEGQGGKLTARYDSTEAKLTTSVTLPMAKPQG